MIRIAIHGGAGTILRETMTPEKEAAYTEAMRQSLEAGYGILYNGGTALDAVEAAVVALEDNHLFNAGRGAVLTHEGHVELDASIVDGRTVDAGAVASVRNIRNPIKAARAVMEQSGHVFLIGEGAGSFAQEIGLYMETQEYFITEDRLKQWKLLRHTARSVTDHAATSMEEKHGTVGAVALDAMGNLAAATSTGGMSNKKYGRVGDSPLIGCGTYANNRTCAISATGYGEYFIRSVCAYDVSAMMEYAGVSLPVAIKRSLDKIAAIGGDGGLIGIDAAGNVVADFNSAGMYRGWSDDDGTLKTLIFEE